METRKEFEITVKAGKRSKTFSFKQASALETLEFLSEARKPDFHPFSWLFWFLNSKCVTQRPFWARSNVTKSEFASYMPELPKIFDTVKNSYFRGAFSEKNGSETEEWSPESSYWAFLAEKLNADPLTLLERYTFEQLADLAKWILWNANAQTEEGRKRNEAERMRRKLSTSDRDAIREAVERLANYHKKP